MSNPTIDARNQQPAASPLPFCKDCRHFLDVKSPEAKCAEPSGHIEDLVYGTRYALCRVMRSIKEKCGKEGALFSAKPADRDPYSGFSKSPSASNRSSLSMMKRASVDSSTMTVATASADAPVPNNDSQIERAVDIRS